MSACIDPLVPALRNDTEFLLIEGDILNLAGRSQVVVQRWIPDDVRYSVQPQQSLRVVSVAENGVETQWQEESIPGQYKPPPGFVAAVGSVHFLRISTASGRLIESRPETVPPPVPVTDLTVEFEAESYFRPAISRFVPAFKYYLSFNDPINQENYYRVTYRKWETTRTCASCQFGRYRDGECIPDNRNRDTWDYPCDTICYKITEGDDEIFISDEFSDGGAISRLEAARIDHTRQTGGLLFEAQLRSISKARHTYLNLIKNLSQDGGSLNATIPAPLVGNLRIVDPGSEEDNINVLGFVGASSEATSRLYFDRADVEGQPLPDRTEFVEEPGVPDCTMIPLGCPPAAPCDAPDRTSIQPEGWGQ